MKMMSCMIATFFLPWLVLVDVPLEGQPRESRGGLKVVLSPVMKQHDTGKNLFWDLRLQNTSDEAMPVASLDNVLLGVIGPDGKPIKYMDDAVNYADVDVEKWEGTVLQSGQYIGTRKFGPLKFNQPGKYTLWVTYVGPYFNAGIESNRVMFTVTDNDTAFK